MIAKNRSSGWLRPILFAVAMFLFASGCGGEISEEVVLVPDSTGPGEIAGERELRENARGDKGAERGEREADLPPFSGSPEKKVFEEIPLYEEVVLKGRLFSLELAPDPESRKRGLLGRESLGDDQGMLFVFPDAEPYPRELSFWMKGCLIPLDVIFISRNGVITAIHEMEPPPPGLADHKLERYESRGLAQFAIELRGGMAEEIGLKVGERIDLRIDYLLSLAR